MFKRIDSIHKVHEKITQQYDRPFSKYLPGLFSNFVGQKFYEFLLDDLIQIFKLRFEEKANPLEEINSNIYMEC